MITSTSNQRVKRLVNLKKKRKYRDAEKAFLVEGVRMFIEVPEDRLREVYVTEDFFHRESALVDKKCRESGCRMEIVSEEVFSYISDTRTPQGVLCIAEQKNSDIYAAEKDKPPLFLMLDNLQDPGNLGTILRTAEAAGVTGVFLSSDCVDIYNPKVIRSTMGSVFRVPFCYVTDMEEAIRHLQGQGVRAYAAHLSGRHSYDKENYRQATAFLIGNEGKGLRREVAELADAYIRIPMEGQVESLNAAVAASILMFEAGRQRRH